MKWIALLVAMVGLSGCASPYVGKTISYNNSNICRSYSLPVSCTSGGDFPVEYTLDSTGAPDQYSINGKAKAGAGMTNAWRHYKNARFTLFLMNDQVITDSKSMTGGSGSLDEPITFSRSFTCKKGFDATAVFLTDGTVID